MLDLWPNQIKKVGAKAPVTILREQASVLGQKTKNIVEGRVYQIDSSREELQTPATISAPLISEPPQTISYHKTFIYDFVLLAPALQNYRYRLFSILHGVHLYPVTFSIDKEMQPELEEKLGNWEEKRITKSEDEFISILKAIFNTDTTLQIIGSMLAQSE